MADPTITDREWAKLVIRREEVEGEMVTRAQVDFLLKRYYWREMSDGYGPCIVCGCLSTLNMYRCGTHSLSSQTMPETSHPLYEIIEEMRNPGHTCPKCGEHRSKREMVDYLCQTCRWG